MSFTDNNSPQNKIILLFFQKNFSKIMFLFCIPVDKILHEVARAALDLEIDLCDVLADHADGEQDQSAPIKWRTIDQMSISPLMKEMNMPICVMRRMGRAESEVTPSHANDAMRRHGYFDTPASLSLRA